MLHVSIRDEGPGLNPEQQARIFEPFFTTKTKGTGLGMALAQRIVEAHEGTIAASSPDGAQIDITLPRETP
jgi:signal transduction histidine kinase